MTWRTLGVMLLFAGLFLVQIGIPAQRLMSGESRPTRFGWQMYSRVMQNEPKFLAEYEDGRIDTLNVDDHVVETRLEINLVPVLPAHICRHLDGIRVVIVDWPSESSYDEQKVNYVCPRSSRQ